MDSKTILEGITMIGIIGFVFIVMNSVFLSILFYTKLKMDKVAKWPSTMGTVTVSTVEYRSSGESGANYPVVHYSYHVGGQSYEGHRIAPSGAMGGIGAGKVAARYPVGAAVKIFYDPQNPSEAFLEKKAHGQILTWIILIIVDLSLCVVAPVMWWLFK